MLCNTVVKLSCNCCARECVCVCVVQLSVIRKHKRNDDTPPPVNCAHFLSRQVNISSLLWFVSRNSPNNSRNNCHNCCTTVATVAVDSWPLLKLCCVCSFEHLLVAFSVHQLDGIKTLLCNCCQLTNTPTDCFQSTFVCLFMLLCNVVANHSDHSTTSNRQPVDLVGFLHLCNRHKQVFTAE